MKYKQTNHHMVDILFTLALFCVFAASALFVVIIGAGVYKSTVQKMNENYNTRTSLAYVTEKIRQNDTENGVAIGELEGSPALILSQQYDNISLKTYIYRDEGYLKELFINDSTTPLKRDGQKILEVHDFTMEQIRDSVFHFTSTDINGTKTEVYISARSKGGTS